MTLDGFFQLRARGTDVRTEVIGGATTFVALSYILVVQPALMATIGMDAGAVFSATCIASAVATALMGVWANYPIAVAPAMGHNFYVVLVVAGPLAAGGLGVDWRVALGANFLAGAAFLLLSLVGIRERLIDAIPDALKHAIAAGIGLLIALVGFEWAGLVRAAPGTLVALGDLHRPATLLAAAGTLVIAALLARGVRGAILLGTVATGAGAVLSGLVPAAGVVAPPPSLGPTAARLAIAEALRPDLVPVVFILFFLGLFDTVGTLVGVAEQAGFLRAGRLPRAREAMATDALGTMLGTALGTTTLTAYVESAAGVGAGARTGLTSLVTAALLLASLFLAPLARLGGAPVPMGAETGYPIVAPALIVVGSLMMRAVARLDFADPTLGIPAFLTIVTMPFAFSITEGIAFGFVSHALLMLVAGRAREVHPFLWLCAGLLVARWIFLV
ncbi:MAG TPA: NCS2 family permease [Candidatus Binatia bacterium]|nr:NCS2 family permease [Candidatus Binatia bacterium]